MRFLPEKKTKKMLTAIQTGDLGTIYTLLNQGVAPMEVYDGTPLLEHAFDAQAIEPLSLLLKHIDIPTHTDFLMRELTAAARSGKRHVLRVILDKAPFLVNQKDAHGDTPLSDAISHGQVAAVDFLLKAGADPRIANKYGFAPLHNASMLNEPAILKILLEHSPEDINNKTSGGYTALMLATVNGLKDIVAFLLEKGADPKEPDNDGMTPLEHAKNEEIIALLKPYYPELIPPTEGWTPLHGEKIACFSLEEGLGYKLTDIFNFKTRERIRILHNLETKVDVLETRDFDEIAEKEPLEEALRQLASSGVETAHLSIRGPGKTKTILGKMDQS